MLRFLAVAAFSLVFVGFPGESRAQSRLSQAQYDNISSTYTVKTLNNIFTQVGKKDPELLVKQWMSSTNRKEMLRLFDVSRRDADMLFRAGQIFFKQYPTVSERQAFARVCNSTSRRDRDQRCAIISLSFAFRGTRDAVAHLERGGRVNARSKNDLDLGKAINMLANCVYQKPKCYQRSPNASITNAVARR